jgi:hypothetical protein
VQRHAGGPVKVEPKEIERILVPPVDEIRRHCGDENAWPPRPA